MFTNVLITLLEEKDYKSIHTILAKCNPVDIATIFEEIDETSATILFRLLDKRKAAEVFSYMENETRQKLIINFTKQEIKDILELMYADDTVDFIEDMPANVVNNLLEHIDVDKRAAINALLQYPENSAGSIMTIEFIELHPEMSVDEALLKIRRVGIQSETVYTCYVVEKHHLLGIVTAKDLLTNPGEMKIKELMYDSFISVKTTDNKEAVANLFRKYGLIALPVVDTENCIVGIVTFDDAMDVLIEETTEDMQKMAAMSSNDEPYLKTSVWKHAKNRIVWLLVLMLSATITGSIISKYENAFAVIPLLVSFIPMLMDTGGNCGSQSSTLIIRGLAIDELHFSDTFKIVWKEFRVSLIISSILALTNGVRIWFIYQDVQLAIVVGIALMLTVIIAKLVGCMLPIVANKLHIDPAIMAAPLITTIVDACSIIIYFQIATLIFEL